MAHLLSRSRIGVVTSILLVSVMAGFVGIVLPYVRGLEDASWAVSVGFFVQLLSLLGVLGCTLYIQHSGPSAADLLQAFTEQEEREKRMMEVWSSVRVRKVTYKGMDNKARLMYLTFLFFAVALPIYGVLDIFGAFPLVEAQDGVIIPGWATGTFAILFGIFSFFMSFMFRTDLVDEEEVTRKLREQFTLIKLEDDEKPN